MLLIIIIIIIPRVNQSYVIMIPLQVNLCRCSVAESGSYASSVATARRWSDVAASNARTYDAADGSGT